MSSHSDQILYVEVVVSRAVGDGRVAPKATDLRETGEPNLFAVTMRISVELCGELLYEVRPFWPRPHHSHIASKYVPRLR